MLPLKIEGVVYLTYGKEFDKRKAVDGRTGAVFKEGLQCDFG